MECLELRVKDLSLERKEVTVRRGKGGKDRVTVVPDCALRPLRLQIEFVRRLHKQDSALGWGRIDLPGALSRKYPAAGRDMAWQYAFPATRRFEDKATGEQRRHHFHESAVQRPQPRYVPQPSAQCLPDL